MPTGSSRVSGWSTVTTSSSVPPHPPQPPMLLHKECLAVYCTACIWWQQVHFTWRSWLVFTVSLLTNSTLNAISMSWQPTSSPCSQKGPQLHKIWAYMMSVFTAKIQLIEIHEAWCMHHCWCPLSKRQFPPRMASLAQHISCTFAYMVLKKGQTWEYQKFQKIGRCDKASTATRALMDL